MTDLPDLKIKALVSFPAAVLDGTGVDVVKQNGSYQFNLDFSDFAPPVGGVADPAHANALLWNDITGQYSLVPISAIGGGTGDVFGPSGATPGNIATFNTATGKLIQDGGKSLAALGAASVNVILKTASGSYTPSAGLLFAEIEVRGSGGGGGGCNQGTFPAGAAGAGGGSGGLSRSILSAAAIGAGPVTITIGAAGAGGTGTTIPAMNGTAGQPCSFGSLVVANGGGGGGGSDPAVANGASGAGGALGTGQFYDAGFNGGAGDTVAGSSAMTLVGGMGGGPGGGAGAGGSNGGNAFGFGAGGGGGARTGGGSAGSFAGGAGLTGYVLIKEYLRV